MDLAGARFIFKTQMEQNIMIKLIKEESGYSYQGTTYLPQINILGSSGHWEVFVSSFEGINALNRLDYYIPSSGYIDTFYTLKSIKHFIGEFDQNIEIIKAEKEQKKAALEAERARLKQAEKDLLNEYQNNMEQHLIDEVNALQVGDKRKFNFANINKLCTLGEYLVECFDQLDSNDVLCKVEKVIDLTESTYDLLTKNLMNEKGCQLCGIGQGGLDSDYETDKNDLCEMDNSEQKQWLDQSYCLVTLVKCKDRTPFVIDAQGYRYARYVGLV
jgi:hypothetical protein